MNSKLKTSMAAAAIALIALPVFADTGVSARGEVDFKAGFNKLRAALDFRSDTSVSDKRDNDEKSDNGRDDQDKNKNDDKRGPYDKRSATYSATSTADRLANAKDRAGKEIQRRIDALTDANTRLQASANVSASVKTLIGNAVQAQISNLVALKAKISADTSIESVKVDIKSINSTYRNFLLVLAQGYMTVSADAVQNVSATMTSIGAKLETRINAAHTVGKDTAALSASLSDMKAKIADAKVQASAAVSLVANLSIGNSDKVNAQAFKDARANLKTAYDELKTARRDIASMVSGLKAITL
jgi:hypothetical protein